MKRVVKFNLSQVTFSRLEELAERMELTVEEAVEEIVKERLRLGRKATAADVHLPVLEAQVFSQCLEAMSVLTEPASVLRVYKYIGETNMGFLDVMKLRCEADRQGLMAARAQYWLDKANAGELTVPPLDENTPAS